MTGSLFTLNFQKESLVFTGKDSLMSKLQLAVMEGDMAPTKAVKPVYLGNKLNR
jgi:hypothetical protein